MEIKKTSCFIEDDVPVFGRIVGEDTDSVILYIGNNYKNRDNEPIFKSVKRSELIKKEPGRSDRISKPFLYNKLNYYLIPVQEGHTFGSFQISVENNIYLVNKNQILSSLYIELGLANTMSLAEFYDSKSDKLSRLIKNSLKCISFKPGVYNCILFCWYHSAYLNSIAVINNKSYLVCKDSVFGVIEYENHIYPVEIPTDDIVNYTYESTITNKIKYTDLLLYFQSMKREVLDAHNLLGNLKESI